MAYSGAFNWESHNQQIVSEGTRALERTSESINRSRQIAEETEQIGTNVVSDLSEQREALLRTQERVVIMNDGISRSNRLIAAMKRHVIFNKILLIIIILLESIILAAQIYRKYIR